METYPDTINSEEQLEELLSRPTEQVRHMFSRLDGDVMFLGAGGKMGLSIASMARRAIDLTGVSRRVIAVSRFSSESALRGFEKAGIEIIQGDLLDRRFVEHLPEVKNIFFLAGMKFGSIDNLPMTWAVNTYLPALVAHRFVNARIVAFSTGSIYPLVPVSSGGSTESDPPLPVGEYAQSCVGRERMFEHVSIKYGTQVVLIRLNYAVEMRYGVLVDIALKVSRNEPVDLEMGHFNVIWQGDANAMILLSLEQCESPPRVLNITGPEILSVREVAAHFGRLMDKRPLFRGREAGTALLSNAGEAFRLWGYPGVTPAMMSGWISRWIEKGGPILNKPTHFEVRNGKY